MLHAQTFHENLWNTEKTFIHAPKWNFTNLLIFHRFANADCSWHVYNVRFVLQLCKSTLNCVDTFDLELRHIIKSLTNLGVSE